MSKADAFDRQVETFETLRDKGDNFAPLRKSLLSGIRGNILEIAPGPGFNFPYYKHIESLTAVDLSPKMIESAEKEWIRVGESRGEFIVADIHDVHFNEGQFDAIVSTCSVCAFDNPVEILNNLATWCKADGFVYLLEHGLSDYTVMKTIQRLYEPIHYKIHACHCNRNIKEIVEQSDLKIVSFEKPRQYAVIDFMYSIVAKSK